MMGNIKRLMPPGIIMSTPPDQKLIEKNKKQKSAPIEKYMSTSQVNDSSNIPLGVYMLENPQTPDAAADRLSITQDLCIQNAEICTDLGQQSKAGIMLTQTTLSCLLLQIIVDLIVLCWECNQGRRTDLLEKESPVKRVQSATPLNGLEPLPNDNNFIELETFCHGKNIIASSSLYKRHYIRK